MKQPCDQLGTCDIVGKRAIARVMKRLPTGSTARARLSTLKAEGMSDLKLSVTNHALAQHEQQHIGWATTPPTARVCRLDMGVEKVLVREGVELQKVELPLQVCNISTHWCSRHTPPVERTPRQRSGMRVSTACR